MGTLQPAVRVIQRLSDYDGDTEVAIAPTQIESATLSAQRAVLKEWTDFFSASPTGITRLSVNSRVPQVLVDSLQGQIQLKSLSLKWGPYSDLAPLERLRVLEELRLGGAKKVEDLTPLVELSSLLTLTLDEPHGVADFTPLGNLSGLRSLSLGNGYPGSDKTLRLGDLTWLRGLRELHSLSLPGTSLDSSQFEVMLDLQALAELSIPLRRSYRSRVFALAESNKAFAGVARNYLDYEAFRDAR